MHDSSTKKSAIQFIQERIASKKYVLDRIDDFYEYWPENYGRGAANEQCFESSKIALYFRRYNKSFSDSSLEYQLTDASRTDTSWHRTGHMILITQFQPNQQYTLLVRYHDFPQNILKSTFTVMPRWYQTTRYRIIFGSIVAVILILIIIVFYKRKIKLEKEKRIRMALEIKSIRSQLNPHFIFNALSSIQGLINKNDIHGANHYLTEFSNLLRETLKNNDKELVPLQTELKILETYLKLEQLRFHFQYEIIIDEKIDKNSVEIPALLLQPLIENAVKHGISTLHGNGGIKIHFYPDQQNLQIMFWDNGIGFTEDITGNGLGLKLTKDRIALLNQSFRKQPIEFSIESKQNAGTTVHLRFVNWL